MAVTLSDIARLAQVSESAVSRALHDHPRISAATRARIQKIAADLDFEANSHARGLSTNCSGTIGVIVPNFGDDVRQSYYLDLLVSDIRAELRAAGRDLLIADSNPAGLRKSNLRRLVLQRKVDGLLLIIGDLADEDRELLGRRRVPVVMVNSQPLALADVPIDGFSCFFTDNLAGGALAANHLADRGCRRFVCLADAAAGPEMVDRTRGFSGALDRRGLSSEVLFCPSDFGSSHRFASANLDLFRGAGVFCHTDVMACALLRAVQEGGLLVPTDLKIVGYDDIELGTYFSPRLTTVHQPREEIARLACRRLADLLEAGDPGDPGRVSVTPRLVVRDSS